MFTNESIDTQMGNRIRVAVRAAANPSSLPLHPAEHRQGILLCIEVSRAIENVTFQRQM
jgi:hypothetical protein